MNQDWTLICFWAVTLGVYPNDRKTVVCEAYLKMLEGEK